MPRPLDGAVGERLELPEYYADIDDNYARAKEFWKLERGQVYAEPDDESWKAFDGGDWEESTRLIEQRRTWLGDYFQRNSARGMVSRRVRIVSLPVTPYLQWELHGLRLRDELGQETRVLLDREVADFEDHGPLPDLNLLDIGVMYQVIYDDNGVAGHALRYADAALVRRCRDFIGDLFEKGEPIRKFFRREVAHLPAPRPVHSSIPHDYLERAGRPLPPRS
jgi:hypothetical protein